MVDLCTVFKLNWTFGWEWNVSVFEHHLIIWKSNPLWSVVFILINQGPNVSMLPQMQRCKIFVFLLYTWFVFASHRVHMSSAAGAVENASIISESVAHEGNRLWIGNIDPRITEWVNISGRCLPRHCLLFTLLYITNKVCSSWLWMRSHPLPFESLNI